MEEIFRSELIWLRLGNAFRFFAIAKMMEEYRSIDGSAPYRQALFSYVPPEVTVARQYPPTWDIDQVEGKKFIHSLYSCGGVSIGAQKLTRSSPSTYVNLPLVREAVLASMKKNPSSAAWRVE